MLDAYGNDVPEYVERLLPDDLDIVGSNFEVTENDDGEVVASYETDEGRTTLEFRDGELAGSVESRMETRDVASNPNGYVVEKFDSDDRLVERAVGANDGVHFGERETERYDVDGNVAERISERYEEDGRYVVEKFDSDDRMTERTVGVAARESVTEKYDVDGNATERIAERYDGESRFETTEKLDVDGNVVETTSERYDMGFDEDGIPLPDEDGDVLRERTIVDSDGNETVERWDENGNPVDSEVESNDDVSVDDELSENDGSLEFEFDEDDETSGEMYDDSPDDVKAMLEDVFERYLDGDASVDEVRDVLSYAEACSESVGSAVDSNNLSETIGSAVETTVVASVCGSKDDGPDDGKLDRIETLVSSVKEWISDKIDKISDTIGKGIEFVKGTAVGAVVATLVTATALSPVAVDKASKDDADSRFASHGKIAVSIERNENGGFDGKIYTTELEKEREKDGDSETKTLTDGFLGFKLDSDMKSDWTGRGIVVSSVDVKTDDSEKRGMEREDVKASVSGNFDENGGYFELDYATVGRYVDEGILSVDDDSDGRGNPREIFENQFYSPDAAMEAFEVPSEDSDDDFESYGGRDRVD